MKCSMAILMGTLILGASSIHAVQGERPQRGEEGSRRAGREEGRPRGHQAGPQGGMVKRLISNPKAAARLGLSDEQIAELKSGIAAIEAKEKELHGSMQELGRKQMELLKSADVERSVIYQVIDQLGDVRTQMAKCRIDRLFIIRSVLSDEQQSQLRKHMQSGHRQARDRKEREAGQRRPKEGEERPSRRNRPETADDE